MANPTRLIFFEVQAQQWHVRMNVVAEVSFGIESFMSNQIRVRNLDSFRPFGAFGALLALWPCSRSGG